ncbi:MAG TPA: AbrB/MazE/SpoVT family DNA-binding domain-containing protein [Candidatus Brocadiaceae bacterium]|nr:AbrB/MazE/SpoVT family DNA-binding domain-containing protein [Candidatus Brocadiaceae bacterium]
MTNKIVIFTIFVRINILVRRIRIMILTSKITSKGQITLPKEVRKLLNVQEGNVIVFEKENDKIVIKPAKTLRDFKGLLKNTKKEETFDEIRKIVKNSVGKRVIQGGR